MRIGFTDQRLMAHDGMVAWTRFITEARLSEQLRAVLPHTPSSNNAYDPTDTSLGFIKGIHLNSTLANLAFEIRFYRLAEVSTRNLFDPQLWWNRENLLELALQMIDA